MSSINNIFIVNNMNDIVTMTAQGQMTIPKGFRDAFGIRGSTKMAIRKEGDTIIVEPRANFWALKGSLKSSVKFSEQNLRKARAAFEKEWARKL